MLMMDYWVSQSYISELFDLIQSELLFMEKFIQAELLMDDGFLGSEMMHSIDQVSQSLISELFHLIQSELLLMEKFIRAELLMDDGFKESEMMHSIPQTSTNGSPNSVAVVAPKPFYFIGNPPSPTFRAHSIPQTGRNRSLSLNSVALGAPEPFTSIRKRRLPTYRAVDIQQRLQTLIAGARQSWTYAIFWKASDDNTNVEKIAGCSEITDLPRILDWGTGYYEGEIDKLSGTQSSKTQQNHRKRSLRDLYHPEEDMNGLKRFFLMSKADIFLPGNGLPGRALCSSTAIWVSGTQKLVDFYCKHADGARECGIQTLVCIPLADGVVELGSSGLIFPDSESDLLDRVRPLFKFRNNICIQEIGTDVAGSSSTPIFPGFESESSVENRPLFQQGDSPSQRDKKTKSNSDSDSESRYIEVFTQILRRI